MFKVLNNIINRKLLYYLGYIIFILKNTFASDFFVDQEYWDLFSKLLFENIYLVF